MVTYQKLKHNDASVVQVESAIRDGNGVKIDTNYARKAIILSNTQVTFSSNPDTNTNTDYPYRGSISATGVTSSTPVDVTFAATSLARRARSFSQAWKGSTRRSCRGWRRRGF